MTLHLRQPITGQDVARLAATPAPSVKWRPYRRVFKRALDVTLVLMAAPAVLFVLVILAAAIAMDGVNPFYRQKRLGQNGRVFSMWKLRSMVRNADALLESHLASDIKARREWELTQKLKVDPRITPIGRIIRKSSLDELPQLWNVLIGDMSLVGPRPMMVAQKELYPGTHYEQMRPGITGLWQISERNECSFADRSIFDSAYHQSMSFKTDCVILVRTLGVVARGTGY
ncbi:sugar transferase [Pseudaestuariivita sp.]|uniref:sugar transferase n=1 Tax=Pseudaestuariivita sp. TaxID=2211669 RepID=UPI00405973DB